MFLTQTIKDLQMKSIWRPVGLYHDCEDPSNSAGYGLGQDVAVEIMQKRFKDKYGDAGMVVNIKITTTSPAYVHHAYNRTVWHVTGDLYLHESYVPEPEKVS